MDSMWEIQVRREESSGGEGHGEQNWWFPHFLSASSSCRSVRSCCAIGFVPKAGSEYGGRYHRKVTLSHKVAREIQVPFLQPETGTVRYCSRCYWIQGTENLPSTH